MTEQVRRDAARSFTFVHELPSDAPSRDVNSNKSLIRSHTARLPRYKSRKVARKSARISKVGTAPIREDGQTLESGDNTISTEDYMENGNVNPRRVVRRVSVTSPSPKCLSLMPKSSYGSAKWQEERSLQFFVAFTATDWAGWRDAELWQKIVPQISTTNNCLRHGLAALGAYHEGLHVGSYDADRGLQLKMLSVAQGQKAVSLFVEQNEAMSVSVRLVMYVILAALNFFLQRWAYLRSLFLQYDFEAQLDVLERDASLRSSIPLKDWDFIKQYVKPSLERQRSKYSQAADMTWALRNAAIADFEVVHPITIPRTWTSLTQAKDVLEDVLKDLVFQIKTGKRSPSIDLLDTEPLMIEWMATLDRWEASQKLSVKERLTVRVLRVTVKITMIAIMTMNTEDEMVFDGFTPVFRELADVFMAACSLEHTGDSLRTNVKFGLDTSIMMLCANTANRFCRCPSVRADLLKAFASTDRTEGVDSASAWAQICELTKNVDERGIDPPPKSCGDIPRENRRRLVSTSFYMNQGFVRVDYLRYPYHPATDLEQYWMPFKGFAGILECPPMDTDENCPPTIIYGRGLISILRPGDTREFYTISNPKFYFNIPRV